MIFMAIIEIRLCNPRRMILKGMSKSLKYMVKFNVSILNRLFVMGFFVNAKYVHIHVILKSICISRPAALCLAPGFGPGPQLVFTGPGPQLEFTGPGPQFVFTDPGSRFAFTCPGPKFLFTGLGQSGTWACIYQPCPPNLYLLALAYDFYYRALNLHLPSYL